MQGGVGAFTRELARAMASLGSEVHIFTRQAAQNADEPGISVYPSVRQRWGWGTLRAVRQWASAVCAEVVNIQFQTAAYNMHPAIHWVPCRTPGVPVIVTFHDLRVPYLFPKAGPARPWLVRKLARDADAVIATDRADEAILRNQWHIPRVRWIPIGSNISTTPPAGYDRDAWRAGLGIGPDELLISYFGFLNESKGGLRLIEALARLIAQGVPARLVMIGGRAGSSDPTNLAYGQRVDAAVESYGLGDRVLWTGFTDDPTVSAHFYASDITVLPYRDGVSLRRGTLMAALAHGRAIVTTHPQVEVPELTGALEIVPPEDPEQLAGAIAHLWADPVRRAQLEQAALRAAGSFTWDSIAQRTLDFFTELLSR